MNQPRIIIGVLTAAPFEQRRAGVRSTWGRDALGHPDVDLVFLVGDPNAKLPRREGDILYLPCPDDYDSLPQKTRWFCLWALAHGGSWERLFKCDDDTYVQVDRLAAGKWAMPVVGCQDGNGDHFHGGAGYLISRNAALAIATHLTAATGLEDWKARDAVSHCGMWFEHDSRFCFNKGRQPGPSNEQMTCHYASPVRMRLLYDAFRVVPANAKITIPRILHHVWLGGSPIPEHLQECRATWETLHPAWDLNLWTDENLPPLANQECFDKLSTPAQKTHLARYELLHRFGGVYADFDVTCRRPIDDLLYGQCGIAAAEDDDAVGIAVLAAEPADPLLERAIAALPDSLRRPGDPPRQSGSGFFTRQLLGDPRWRLLWWDRFYPTHWSGRVEASVDEAYAVHHWEASWRR
jgi:inositol phosphorylceramide mannosyltransferase catalytic subunit